MTPEEQNRLARVEGLLAQLIASDRYYIGRNVQMSDGSNFQFGNTTGTKIGSAGKLGFFNTTPTTQPADLGTPSFSTVNDVQVYIAALRTNVLRPLGLTA